MPTGQRPLQAKCCNKHHKNLAENYLENLSCEIIWFAKILFIHRLVSSTCRRNQLRIVMWPKDETSGWWWVALDCRLEMPNWRTSSSGHFLSSIISQLSDFKDNAVDNSLITHPSFALNVTPSEIDSRPFLICFHGRCLLANKFETSIQGPGSFCMSPGILSNTSVKQEWMIFDSRTNTLIHTLSQHFLNGHYNMTNDVNPGLYDTQMVQRR